MGQMIKTTKCPLCEREAVLPNETLCRRCGRTGGKERLAEKRVDAKEAEVEARAEKRRVAERLRRARQPGGGLGKKSRNSAQETEEARAERRARQLEISQRGPAKGSSSEVKGGRGSSRKSRQKARKRQMRD